MAITTYSELKTEVSAWVRRASDSTYTGEADTFIDLAEAAMSRMLIGHPNLDESTTLSTDSSGEATLPSDFQAVRSAIWDGSYDQTLDPVSWGALQNLNVTNVSGVPVRYAIQGTTIKVGPIAEGSLILNYWETLPALSGSNTTNWLLTAAPDAYLAMCLAEGHEFNEHFDKAQTWRSKATAKLMEVAGVGQLAIYANAGVILESPSP